MPRVHSRFGAAYLDSRFRDPKYPERIKEAEDFARHKQGQMATDSTTASALELFLVLLVTFYLFGDWRNDEAAEK